MIKLNFQNITDQKVIAEAIAEAIIIHLEADKKVLWLIPGGSSISVVVAVARILVSSYYEKLTVTLTDERYGEINHPDSNWSQLQQAGLYLPKAHLIPVLSGKDKEATTEDYAMCLKEELANTDYSIGFFGIGDDGHTAGILPSSPAVHSEHLTADYSGGNFERITITPKVIAQLDEAFVYAVGESKWAALLKLESEVALNEEPAQILKQVPKLTIFTDYLANQS
jgi:6-phosphogluconolactonase/glucosamine-6-phosphate isomerase/deaminase